MAKPLATVRSFTSAAHSSAPPCANHAHRVGFAPLHIHPHRHIARCARSPTATYPLPVNTPSRPWPRLLWSTAIKPPPPPRTTASSSTTISSRSAGGGVFSAASPPATLRPLHTTPFPLSPRQPPLRSHPQAEPRHPDEILNPSGRIYSVPPPGFENRDDHDDDAERGDPSHDFNANPPPLLRPVAFSLAFSAATLALLALYSERSTEEVQREVSAQGWDLSSWFGPASFGLGIWSDAPKAHAAGGGGVSERKLREAVVLREAERAGWRLEWLRGWCDRLGLGEAGVVVQRCYTALAEEYLNLPPDTSPTVPIIAVNTCVFLLWCLPSARVRRFMRTHFAHRPASGRSYTLLTSTFSHSTPLHFLFNNVALYSIGASALLVPTFLADDAGTIRHTPEASTAPHFFALFVLAGLASSTASHVVTAARWRSALRRTGFSQRLITLNRQSSLGSSGAIYAALVMSAMALPQARVSLIFLPFFSLPISYGVGSMVALDLLGVARGWQVFDHVAHLAGAAAGVAYFWRGNGLWERVKLQWRRELEAWREDGGDGEGAGWRGRGRGRGAAEGGKAV